MDHKTDTDSERASFEAWARNKGYQRDELNRCRTGIVGPEYYNLNTEMAWQAFLAGRASLAASAGSEPAPDRAFLERTLSAMEGVIDVADRKTAEFDALRSCVIDLTLMLFKAAPTPAAQVDDAACQALEAPSVTADAREAQMVVLSRDGSGKPTVWCDPEIAPIVAALNAAGLRTVASCAGHGNAPGVISLADGRSVVIARDNAECEVMTRVRGRDVNGAPIPPKGYTWMPITPTLAMLDAMRADTSDRLDQRYSNLLAAAQAAKGGAA